MNKEQQKLLDHAFWAHQQSSAEVLAAWKTTLPAETAAQIDALEAQGCCLWISMINKSKSIEITVLGKDGIRARATLKNIAPKTIEKITYVGFD